MALNTYQKRGSVIAVSGPWRSWVAVPSGGFDSRDRLGIIYYASAIEPDEFVPPPEVIRRDTGAGKAKKGKRRRYEVEVDGEVFDVETPEDAEAILAKVRQDAEAKADLALERAAKPTRRQVRKVMQDVRKALVPPVISGPPAFMQIAADMLAKINETYRETLRDAEIAARSYQYERAIEADDEEILLLL